jgi:hypothetical protein
MPFDSLDLFLGLREDPNSEGGAMIRATIWNEHVNELL